MEPRRPMIDAALWSLFVGLLAGSLFFAWPRAPGWDPVMFHSVVLATLHRGELEAAGKVLADWQARLASALPQGPRPPSGGWTEDPALLGREYDPAHRLGAACSWDNLAAQTAEAKATIARRLNDTIWVNLGPIDVDIPEVVRHTLVEFDAAAINGLAPLPEQRIVLATRAHPQEMVKILLDNPRLRDRTRAVVFVGATLAALPELSQLALDTEIDRTTPWFFLHTPERPGPVPDEPPVPASGRRSVQFFDLGMLPSGELNSPHLARSLAVLLAAT